MGQNLQSIRGMNDILPEHVSFWQHFERVSQSVLRRFGYQEMRLPLLEHTGLFLRAVGEATDIVEKEMYTFADRGGESMTLRPELTASVVRSLLQHGLLRQSSQRVWTQGALFRYERPQKGRYRQFHQLDVEALGLKGPDIDAELIALSALLLEELGLAPHVALELNTLGTPAVRQAHRAALVDYFSAHASALDEDSQQRLTKNPLRILDSKNEQMQALIAAAPTLLDFLDDASKYHFDGVQNYLTRVGIPYKINTRLVRGLDYYTHTVFEWTATTGLGAQTAVAGGGRYDGLVEQLGGVATPAVGFAAGIERIMLVYNALKGHAVNPSTPHIYFLFGGEPSSIEGSAFAHQWRQQFPALRLLCHCGGGSLKSQFKKADKSQAAYAFIFGEEEMQRGHIAVKPLRNEGEQVNIALDQVPKWLVEHLGLIDQRAGDKR